MLAHSFLIKLSSKLLVTRTGIKARMSLISGLWFPWPIYMFFLNEIWPWHIGLRWAIVALWATCLNKILPWHIGLRWTIVALWATCVICIIIKLAGNQHSHKILEEFESCHIRPLTSELPALERLKKFRHHSTFSFNLIFFKEPSALSKLFDLPILLENQTVANGWLSLKMFSWIIVV